MKFAMKETLVVTLPRGGDTCDDTRYVHYVDTDEEKLAFISWFLENLNRSILDENSYFRGLVARFPDASLALYFQRQQFAFPLQEEECVFPLRNDADKLALFDMIVAGVLDGLLDEHYPGGPSFKKVKTKVAVDT